MVFYSFSLLLVPINRTQGVGAHCHLSNFYMHLLNYD
jgi:hypothetical protein